MCGNGADQLVGREVFLPPEVTELEVRRDVFLDVNLFVFFANVEDAEGLATICKRTCPHFDVTILGNAVSLLAKDVLVDEIDLVIAEKTDGEVIHLSDVATNEHIGGKKRPKRDVGVLLVGCETAVAKVTAPSHFAHDEHVGVVPMSGSGIFCQTGLTAETYVVH